MKYCDQCGTQLKDNAKFCSVCGASTTALDDLPENKKCQSCGKQLDSNDVFVPTAEQNTSNCKAQNQAVLPLI